MKIKTSVFKNAINSVKPALGSKDSTIAQSASFAFSDETVFAYNDEISIMCPLPGLDFTGTIKSEELFKFINKVKKDEFDFEVEDGEAIFKSGRSKAGFVVDEDILLPVEDELSDKGDWFDLPEKFVEGASFGMASAATSMAEPKLTCIHVKQDGIIEASDNYKVVVYSLEEEMPIATTLIPAKSIKEVVKLRPTMVSEGAGWVHFKNENGVVISCRIMNEEFVPVEGIFKQIKKGKKVTFPDKTLETLTRAEIFAKDAIEGDTVSLIFKGKQLVIKSENETSWFEEIIRAKIDDEFEFSIAPYLLRDILKQTNVCYIGKSLLKFEGDNWTYVSTLKSYKSK